MAKVGFAGRGIMGAPMCRNLLAAGHDVAVFDRSREKTAPLAAAGAKAAESPGDLARRSEVPAEGSVFPSGVEPFPAFLI